MKRDVRIYPDLDALSLGVAEAVVSIIQQSIRTHDSFSIALSGGSTPRTLYRLLSSKYRDEIPWSKVHMYWGDERYVLLTDPNSNYRMARESLLDAVPCPAENVHPMPTQQADPDLAARDYEKTLRIRFPKDWPSFDLVLLGLGEEGHTASLFPRSPALDEMSRWVVAVKAPAAPPLRLTLTLPALDHAANIYVLATGANKAQALHNVLDGAVDPKSYPASGIRVAQGSVIWWIDRDAAALLSQ